MFFPTCWLQGLKEKALARNGTDKVVKAEVVCLVHRDQWVVSGVALVYL